MSWTQVYSLWSPLCLLCKATHIRGEGPEGCTPWCELSCPYFSLAWTSRMRPHQSISCSCTALTLLRDCGLAESGPHSYGSEYASPVSLLQPCWIYLCVVSAAFRSWTQGWVGKGRTKKNMNFWWVFFTQWGGIVRQSMATISGCWKWRHGQTPLETVPVNFPNISPQRARHLMSRYFLIQCKILKHCWMKSCS